MSTIREKWAETRPLYKRIVTAITAVSGIVAIYTAMNIFMGVTVRPAWSWELIDAVERNDTQYEQLELRYVGMAVDVAQGNRREYSRSLNQFRAMRDEYIRNGQPVPGWLTQEISDGEQDVLKTDESIRILQQELINSDN